MDSEIKRNGRFGRGAIIAAFATVGLAVAVIAAIVTRGDGESVDRETAYPSRTAEVDDVTVEATLETLDTGGAVVRLVFDTHVVELDFDVVTGSALIVDGVAWPASDWQGDGPSGHHREGRLRFTGVSSPAGEAVLTVVVLSEPMTFRWSIGAGGET